MNIQENTNMDMNTITSYLQEAQILMDFSRAVSAQTPRYVREVDWTSVRQQLLPFQVDDPPSYLSLSHSLSLSISLSLSEEVDRNIDELFQDLMDDEEEEEIEIIEDNPFRIDVFCNEYDDDDDDEDVDCASVECPICFEKCEIKNVCILQCNKAHRYCCGCLVQQLEKSMNVYQEHPRQLQNIRPKCALCRETIRNITCYSNESEGNIKNVLL